MSSVIVQSTKYSAKNKKNTNTARDPTEFENLQGWFEFGECDEKKNSVSWLNGLCVDPDSCMAASVQSECVMTQNDLWVIQFVFVSLLTR